MRTDDKSNGSINIIENGNNQAEKAIIFTYQGDVSRFPKYKRRPETSNPTDKNIKKTKKYPILMVYGLNYEVRYVAGWFGNSASLCYKCILLQL